MSLFYADLPNLVINSGATASNAITGIDDADCVTIYAPAALTGTVTVRVEPTTTGTSFVDAGDGTGAGSDITIGAGNSRRVIPSGARQLMVRSGSAEAATRTFTVGKQFRVR